LRKKLLHDYKSQTKSVPTWLNYIRKHQVKFIQESHPVHLTKKLLLSCCTFDIIWSMMKWFRFIGRSIIDWLNLLFLILVITNNFLQGGNEICHDSRHKRMIWHFFNGYSFTFIWDETSSYEIFKIFRKILKEIDIVFIDFFD
jgi:hypothetical protein